MIHILNVILKSLISNSGVFKKPHSPPRGFLRFGPGTCSLANKLHGLQMVKGHLE